MRGNRGKRAAPPKVECGRSKGKLHDKDPPSVKAKMEVVVAEEKKKIFRARKTMKISDRQQLETLHNTLLTTPSPPPLVNGTHKEDGQKASDKEQNNTSDSNSPAVSPVLESGPTLSLNLSPSSSESPKDEEEENPSTSPFHSINMELKKMEEEQQEKKDSSPAPTKDQTASAPTDAMESESKEPGEDKKEEAKTAAEGSAAVPVKDRTKDVDMSSAVPPLSSNSAEPMETDGDKAKEKGSQTATFKQKVERSSPVNVTPSDPSSSSPPASHPTQSSTAASKQTMVVKEEVKEESKAGMMKTRLWIPKKETKNDKNPKFQVYISGMTESSRPSSTPPCDTGFRERGSGSALKRTLSEGHENDTQSSEKDIKRPKMEGVELEAQLELKITAKASSRHKLEKIVQQLVDERLKVLELTVFDKNLQDLKARVDKVDSASKHQTALNTLQTKIARLAKKFGEANQMTENKRKQEALAAAAAAAAASTAASASVSAAVTTTTAPTATAAKPVTSPNTAPAQRQVRPTVEVKQTPTILKASTALAAAAAQAASTSTTSAMVPQGPILQLITSTSSAAPTLATGITSQSPTGTLLLKTAPGGSMMTAGQPLLIQLPLSMANGQAGTLVNIPVSSLSAANSLNKTKTSTSTATFILKPAPVTTTAAASAPAAVTVSALQTPSGQISLARPVYQGGAGGISAPNAGVSVTTARTPAQTVSAAGALSSTSSPASSGPAATGSTAPGPPQGVSLTSKTDNQASGSTPVKTSTTSPATPRPKGSVIDLTEDDDDVQVTGVQNATAPPTTSSSSSSSSSTQRPLPTVSISLSAGARSSPQSNLTSSNPQLTIHHRPPQDSPAKSRPVTAATPLRGPIMSLPALPSAPPPPSRLPPEAAQTSPPQQPQLKLVPSQTGIVLSWCVAETDRSCAAVDSYHLYAFHQDSSTGGGGAQQHWKKIGEVNALPLPMACTLTQFQSGSTYHFAVRAKDIYGRFGAFCEPQCTNVINSSTS